MVKVDLVGVHKVKSKGNTYYYAWRERGAPRLKGEPGTPEFIVSYNEAVAQRNAPDNSRFRAVVTAYKASPDYQKLADSTKKQWNRWLDRIALDFGDLRVAQFDRTDKIRPIIRQWRSQFAETPRTADYALQVLSRVLSYAVDPLGRIASNPCEGIKHLYSSNRSGIIWTEAEITELRAVSSQEVMHIVDLAALTGLRQGDLVRLSWSHIGEDAIMLPTGKSGKTVTAIVPLYDELRTLLASIPKRSTTVLTNTQGKPWTSDGFRTAFDKAKRKAGMQDRDLHFHDLRGTAATNFYIAGLPERVIAEILAWKEAEVAKIIRRYVGRHAATETVIRHLNEARSRTATVKPDVKLPRNEASRSA